MSSVIESFPCTDRNDLYAYCYICFAAVTNMANKEDIQQFSKQDLHLYLIDELGEEVGGDTLDTFEEHRITGKAFLELDDNDLQQLAPRIGEQKAVKRLIASLKPPTTQVSVCNLHSVAC